MYRKWQTLNLIAIFHDLRYDASTIGIKRMGKKKAGHNQEINAKAIALLKELHQELKVGVIKISKFDKKYFGIKEVKK